MTSSDEPTPAQVADRLHSAAIHLLRRVRKVDEETGLSAARLSALSVLVFGGPTTLGALARAEQVSAATMSRLVDGLVRDGLATREPNAADGRSFVVHTTSRGQVILQRGRERRIAELTGLVQALGSDELRTLDAAARLVEEILAFSPSA